jgi:nucleotide-binding universal stress UspA family protein
MGMTMPIGSTLDSTASLTARQVAWGVAATFGFAVVTTFSLGWRAILLLWHDCRRHPTATAHAAAGPAIRYDCGVVARNALPASLVEAIGRDDMFKHILVPTDGSQLSSDTVKRAVGFAKDAGAHVTFFFAKPDYPVAFYGEGALIDPTTPEKFAEMADKQARDVLSACEATAAEAGVPCTSVASTSDIPYEAIIDAADSAGCDLIFMASHGRRGISGLLLGSETQKVLTHSKVPVLVYR